MVLMLLAKAKNVFRVAVVPLHGDLDFDAVFFALEINDFGMNRRSWRD